MKFVNIFLAMTLITNVCLAECDFSTGITKTEAGYVYTKECHVKVGETVRDLDIANKQNVKLNDAILFKDTAITKADERAELWRTTSFKLEDRINLMDDLRKSNQALYFGLGILTMFAAGYMASQLKK